MTTTLPTTLTEVARMVLTYLHEWRSRVPGHSERYLAERARLESIHGEESIRLACSEYERVGSRYESRVATCCDCGCAGMLVDDKEGAGLEDGEWIDIPLPAGHAYLYEFDDGRGICPACDAAFQHELRADSDRRFPIITESAR